MSSMRPAKSGKKRHRQRGGMLIETAIAMFLFSLIGTTVLTGVSTGALSSMALDTQSTLENLARNQMEFMLSEPYQAPVVPTASCSIDSSLNIPTGYGLVCEVAEFEPGVTAIATLRVTVTHVDGGSLALETMRAE